jgi:RNA polymerase sigma-70 factor, ECF subfamily
MLVTPPPRMYSPYVVPSDPASRSDPLPPFVAIRIRGGDDAAFELVFRTYYEPLCAFAFRFVTSSERAEDLVQDAFSALWTSRATLEIRTSLRAYLYASVRNRALNLRKHDEVVGEWERDESDDDVRLLHPHPLQPDELLDRDQLGSRLAAAFDALPERCAVIMRLRWREQLSYAEIAESVGISVKGVEKQLSRGLLALRTILSS